MFLSVEDCPQFPLHMPFPEKHQPKKLVEKLPKEDILSDDIAEDFLDWIVLHMRGLAF